MHDSLESYAIIDQNRLVTRKEIIKQMNTKLPNSIEELLFGELLKNVKNNHTSMSEPIDTYRFLPPLSNPLL